MGCYLSWGSLPLILCMFPAVLLLCSHGCFVEERAALMDIRSSLISANSMVVLDSWGRRDDCCSWERVACNNRTQRISRLDLSFIGSTGTWYLNFTVFSAFHELQFLDLSWNYNSLISLEGSVVLPKLRYLDLSVSMLGGSILSFISKFHSLEVLALNWNNITGGLPSAAFENLRNLRELKMSMNGLSGNLPALLFALPRLKILDLSENLFTGSIPISSSSGPIALEVLDLRFNGISGPLPVTALKNIRTLCLGFNKFNGSFPASLFYLSHLKFLDLSRNSYQGHIPASSSLEQVPLQVLDPHNNLTSILPTKQVFQYLLNLKELDLSNNEFTGNLPTFLFSLPNIELLDLSRNLLEGPILINSHSNFSLSLKSIRFARNNLSGRFSFMWLSKLTKLQEIDFSGNTNLAVDMNIPGWIPPFQLKQLSLSGCDIDKNIIAEPHFLRTQHQLVLLNLSGNSLLGRVPNWLFTNESTLMDLDLGNNLLTGSFGPIQFRQNFLQSIRLSMNHIEGQLPGNISSMFPDLFALDVSDNDITGHIPMSLCQISLMQYLDFSNNKFSGEVPSCMFTNYSMLYVLNLSNNKLSGPIFGGVNKLSIMCELSMNSNKFEGMIPRNLSGTTRVIDLHDNELSGKLDSSFWNLSSLIVLNLASNRLSGELHPQICSLSRIQLLDLSNNNLTGSFPECSSKWMLRFLNLSRNSLSGDFSNVLYNTSSLITLDIRYNHFMGDLNWVRYLDNIRLLSLGANMFEGPITPDLCKLRYLRIIDISHNKLQGSLPSCMGTISFKGDEDDKIFHPPYRMMSDYYNTSYDLEGFTFGTKWNLYAYSHNFFMLMSGIDLSANMLEGEIPWELGNLSHIKALNLSYNLFDGPIPTTLSGMNGIESLDLSHNNLTGTIPLQLNQLCSLEAFSVAYNNLSGCIPDSGQLSSFSMESYQGNINLHKLSQGNKCLPSSELAEEKEVYSDPLLYVISAVSFVLALWATVAFLFCHSFGLRVILQL